MLVSLHVADFEDLTAYNSDEDGDAYLEFSEKIVNTDKILQIGKHFIKNYNGQSLVTVPIITYEGEREYKEYAVAAGWDNLKKVLGIPTVEWMFPYTGYNGAD